MDFITCPHCGTETSSQYNFCVACDKQWRCLNRDCGKLLITGKTFCLGCGQPLTSVMLPQSQPNTYIRNMKQQGRNYEEHVEFSVSDHAVTELAPFIVGQMLSPSTHRVYEKTGITGPANSNRTVPPITAMGEHQEVPQLPLGEPEPPATDTVQLSQPLNGAARYFVRDGDFLVATVKDFRGKNWAHQQKHFVLLYASAYHQIFQGPISSKEHLKSAAEKTGVYDSSNFTRYLGEVIREYFTELSTGYQLNPDGEKEITRIIALIDDDKAKPGHEYWSRASTPPAKRPRLSNQDKSKLHEWAQEEVQLGSLDIRRINKARDYALVSLWVIIAHLKKAEAVRWNDAYYYFKEKYKAISASPEAFSYAIKNDTNKYFRQTDDLFFLSPEGQEKVENWIAGELVESSENGD